MEISDKELEKLRKTNISDLNLNEKFILIQKAIGEDVVDYKSKWWLDTIFDEFITKKFNVLQYNEKDTYSTEIIIFDKNLDCIDVVDYTSTSKTSIRHDSMLNCLVLFSKNIDTYRKYMGNIK